MNFQEMRTFYVRQIQDDFLPYWRKFVDTEQGGILNCINNYGDKKLSDHKFTWSQGRWLWILGRIHDLNKRGVFPDVSQKELEQRMAETYRFLTEKSIYGDSVCCYLLTRSGQKLKDERTGRYDASIYADCFALIGMSQYTKTMGMKENVPVVESLYKSIVRRIESNDFLTEPYPIPKGYAVHGIPMILVNTVQEYILMRRRLGLPCEEEIAYVRGKVEFILDRLYDGKGHIREHISDTPDSAGRMLNRHVNPGHTVEDAWFLVEFLRDFGGLEHYLPRICEIVKTTFDLGWDKEFGGLLRFVDRDGGKPAGTLIGTPYETLIEETWDMKLWWPHAEILYIFPLLYSLTGDEGMEQRYEKSRAYVFDTFPNRELGEWVQIRRRNGSPQDKLVALPVKDPFHIMRDFLKIIELCLEQGA
jgi:N-acylglucosamine 2-epimerase